MKKLGIFLGGLGAYFGIFGTAAQGLEPVKETQWSVASFLELVSSRNSTIQAANMQREALKLNQERGDFLELAPVLMAQSGILNDKMETAFPGQQGIQTRAKYYGFGMAKAFSSGTKLGLNWSQNRAEILGTPFAPPLWESRYTLTLSQSLWKNSFGAATRMRHEKEDAQTRAGLVAAELQKQQILMQAETRYWSYFSAASKIAEVEASLGRALRLQRWVEKRLRDGIGDKADILQAKSLVAARELERLAMNAELRQVRMGFWDSLEAPDTAAPLLVELKKADDFKIENGSLRAKQADEIPQRLDTWLQQYAASAIEKGTQENLDALNPDLNLVGSLGANDRDYVFGTSTSAALRSLNPMYSVGVNVSVVLDVAGRRRLVRAAKIESDAAKLKAESLLRQEEISWSELELKFSELQARQSALKQLALAQQAQLDREQERLNLGRSTTFQIISFEQDVANSQQGLHDLTAGIRKLKSSARLFATQSELESL